MVHQTPMGSDCEYNQPALLNLSNGDKQYDAVVVNTNNYKETMKLHIQISCTCKFMIHICARKYVNTGQERVYMTKSFIFNIKTRVFKTE